MQYCRYNIDEELTAGLSPLNACGLFPGWDFTFGKYGTGDAPYANHYDITDGDARQ